MDEAIKELNAKMATSGYHVEYKALRYVRGWPQRSTKPYQLWDKHGHVASFAKLAHLERNWRNRTGV